MRQVKAYLHAPNVPPVRTHRNPECLPAQAALLENLLHRLVTDLFFFSIFTKTDSEKNSGSISCSPCPAGTYMDRTGADVCQTCGMELASDAGATVCVKCLSGSYNKDHVCTLCAAGTYAGNSGMNYCPDCYDGISFAPTPGSSICQKCSVVDPCPIGTQKQTCNITTNAICAPCPSIAMCLYTGSACKNVDGTPACLCLPGYYMGPTKTACLLCPAGQFKADNSSATFCKPWTSTACQQAGYFRVQGTPFQVRFA